jgi:5,10-methylenetetrahydromethanopterin reductase
VSIPSTSPLGILLAGISPSTVPELARRAEVGGLSSIWAPEDYPERPAGVMAALAIPSTSRITIATGVTSLATRHPLVAAMEAAALADAAPGRFVAGLGLGLPATLEPLGCRPERPVGFMSQRVDAVRRLLAGETVTSSDAGGILEGVSLAHPPASPPPIALGGLGPRMLAMAGDVADQVVISSLGSPRYQAWARDQVMQRARAAGRPMPRVVAFAWYHVADDDSTGRETLRPNVGGALGFLGGGPLTDADGWSEQLDAWRHRGDDVTAALPHDWIDAMTVAGTPQRCAAAIDARLQAGADEVVLCPMGADPLAQLERTIAEVMPRLG